MNRSLRRRALRRKALIAAAAATAIPTLLAASPASAGPTTDLHINEIVGNPETSNDVGEYVELKGAPNAIIPANTYLVFVESDASTSPTNSQGDVQNIFSLGGLQLGANGFLVFLDGTFYGANVNPSATVVSGSGGSFVGVPGYSADAGSGRIENESWTAFLITSTVAPTLTTDIDPGNTGAATLPPEWVVLDGVSALEPLASDPGYATAKFDDGEWVGRPTGDPSGLAHADWVGAGFGNTATTYPFPITGVVPATYEGDLLDHIGGPNFPVTPDPVVPEVPIPAMLGLTTAALMGGAWLVTRRRAGYGSLN